MVQVNIEPLVDAVIRVQNVLKPTWKEFVFGIPVLQMIYSASFIIRKHQTWKRVTQLPVITSDVDDQCLAGRVVQEVSLVKCATITTATNAPTTKTTTVLQIEIPLILITVS